MIHAIESAIEYLRPIWGAIGSCYGLSVCIGCVLHNGASQNTSSIKGVLRSRAWCCVKLVATAQARQIKGSGVKIQASPVCARASKLAFQNRCAYFPTFYIQSEATVVFGQYTCHCPNLGHRILPQTLILPQTIRPTLHWVNASHIIPSDVSVDKFTSFELNTLTTDSSRGHCQFHVHYHTFFSVYSSDSFPCTRIQLIPMHPYPTLLHWLQLLQWVKQCLRCHIPGLQRRRMHE